MNARQTELAHFGEQIEWLSEADAAKVYNYAMKFCSRKHYGLEPLMVQGITHIDVDLTDDFAAEWLTSRVGIGRLRVIYGEMDVFVTSSSFFIANWQDMFCPSRDDVLILPEEGNWVLFYCHEDEFEHGIRRVA